MTPQTLASDVPRSPNARRAWARYHLDLRNISLSQLAEENGKKTPSLSQAFLKPSIHCEKILAKALGLKPQELFPERFDDKGRRLRRFTRNETTTPPKRGNGKSAGEIRHGR